MQPGSPTPDAPGSPESPSSEASGEPGSPPSDAPGERGTLPLESLPVGAPVEPESPPVEAAPVESPVGAPVEPEPPPVEAAQSVESPPVGAPIEPESSLIETAACDTAAPVGAPEPVEPALDESPTGPQIYLGDNLAILPTLPDASFELIYVDPPFNTGRTQTRTQIQVVRDEDGDRTGFSGRRYRTIKLGTRAYADVFDDYIEWLWPRLEHAHRLLAPTGSLFLHLDYREVHYAKVALDQIFGRASFMNEIVWAYDYGARSRSRWSAKHDNILWYAKDPARYTFEYEAIDRIPYMAPGLVGPVKAARGKTPTDTWWSTIVSPSGKEKTGYPTQKPLKVIERIVRVHSRPGDRLLDFFAGSGTLGEAAARLGRQVVLIDHNPEAIEVMRRRLSFARPRFL